MIILIEYREHSFTTSLNMDLYDDREFYSLNNKLKNKR